MTDRVRSMLRITPLLATDFNCSGRHPAVSWLCWACKTCMSCTVICCCTLSLFLNSVPCRLKAFFRLGASCLPQLLRCLRMRVKCFNNYMLHSHRQSPFCPVTVHVLGVMSCSRGDHFLVLLQDGKGCAHARPWKLQQTLLIVYFLFGSRGRYFSRFALRA